MSDAANKADERCKGGATLIAGRKGYSPDDYGCASDDKATLRDAELQSVEREAVCAMADDIRWGPFGNVEIEQDAVKAEGLTALAKPGEFKTLPTSLKCVTRRKRLHGRNDGTPFDFFWLSDDRDYAAISGGWIAGELTGGGAICYYNRAPLGWRRKGCVETWAI